MTRLDKDRSIKFEDLSEKIRGSITEYNDDFVEFNERRLTATEITRLEAYLKAQNYK